MSAELIDLFLVGDDVAAEAAAVALGESGETGLTTLRDLQSSTESDVRFWMIRGLWANGSEAAIALLIEMLQDPEEMVCSGAAFALGELKAEAAVDGLAALATQDASANGNHAADALGKIGKAATPALIEAITSEQSWVRVRAAKALVQIEDRSSIEALFNALIGDESYMVRHYADIALERMGVGQMVYFT